MTSGGSATRLTVVAEAWEGDYYRALGARVRARRVEHGVSQAELASELGLTRASVTNLEAGRQRPLAHQLVAIAALLDADPRDLIGDRPNGAYDPERQLHRDLYSMAQRALADSAST